MLQLNNVDVSYGNTQVLWDINLIIKPNEIVCIVGSNGAGKTTIARILSGLLPVKRGSVIFDGKDITNLSSDRILSAGLTQVPEGRQLFTDMTVYENLELGAYNKKCKKEMPENLMRVYDWFPRLKEREHQLAGTLSGGEQQMLAIARSYLSMPKLLVFDEPSLGLAPNIVDQIMRVAKQLASEGVTIILIEQDVRKALRTSNRGYVLENGIISFSGKSEELTNNENIKKAYLGF